MKLTTMRHTRSAIIAILLTLGTAQSTFAQHNLPLDPSTLTAWMQPLVTGQKAVPNKLSKAKTLQTNKFIGEARLKYRLIEGRDTTEWIVDYASTAELAVLLRQSISEPESAPTALVVHRKAGDETRYTLDRATGKVSAAPPTKLRTEHAPEYITPMRVYTIGDETTDVLGRPCSLHIHETGRGRRFAWVDPKTPSIFLDLFSARKGWDGIEEYIQGKQLGLGIDGITLHVAGYDHGGMNIVMEVLSLERGPVDPNVFSITKDSWK